MFKVYEIVNTESLAAVATWAMRWNKRHPDKKYEPWNDKFKDRRPVITITAPSLQDRRRAA